MDTAIITEIVLIPPYVTIIDNGGTCTSSIVISFENLVVILPIGLESKKRIFALSTFILIS